MVEELRKVSLFSKLSPEDLERLEGMVKEVRLPAGEELFAEGDPGDWAYVIRRGWIEISKHSAGRRVVLAVRREGEVIGEMALLENAPRMAGARAVTDCLLLAIGKEQLDELLAGSPAAARAMLHTVSGRLKDTEGMLHQSEKMAQLGTLTAGMAHELNNPASAALRGAEQLRLALDRLQVGLQRVLQAGLTPDQMREVARRVREAQARTEQPEELGALDRGDREEQVEGWLQERGLDGTVEDPGELVSLGYGAAELQELQGSFGAAALPAVLDRLLSVYGAYSLLAQIGRGAEQVSRVVAALKGYLYHDQAPEQEVDVHQGLDNTLIILRSLLKGGVQVRREYAHSLPRIRAYGSELNQVWTNLIANAAQAMEGKGQLILRTRREGARVVVEVADDGPGIPPELQAQVFSPFFTTKPVGTGTGLGLNISYNIVKKHGGSIGFRSRPGSTVFEVRLPLDFAQSRGESPSLPGVAGVRDERLREILAATRTIAVVGAARLGGSALGGQALGGQAEGEEPARAVPAYLEGQGYRVIPVGAGSRYPDLASISEPVELVLVFLSPEEARPLIGEAARKGATALWLQRGVFDEAAVAKADEAGLELVMDRCIRSEHLRLIGEAGPGR
jgi:signal transduction histidine kinase/predicted CoA-binding protein